MTTHFQLQLKAPSTEDFIAMREKVGWGSVGAVDLIQAAEQSLRNTLFHVTIYDHAEHLASPKLVAMGRVIGDGAMYFYIQDVVVLPEYQGFGLGDKTMQAIESYLENTVTTGATIGLLAAKGKEAFYERYGYQQRNGESLGLGMCKFVK